MAEQPDAVDAHVGRWATYWQDNPAFVPEVEGAITRMQSIAKRLRRDDAAAFAGEQVTSEDYETLHALMVQPYPTEATPSQLADAVRVSKASMTVRLDRLEEARLITREGDPTNRRRVLIRPTEEGRATWERYVHQGMAREQKVLAALSPAELVQLNALLRKVVRSFT